MKPSEKGEMFCTIMKYFFRGSCSIPYTKTLLKVSDLVFEQNPKPVNNLEGHQKILDTVLVILTIQ